MRRVTLRELSQNRQSALNDIRQDELDCNGPDGGSTYVVRRAHLCVSQPKARRQNARERRSPWYPQHDRNSSAYACRRAGLKIQGSFEGSAASVTFGIRRNAAR